MSRDDTLVVQAFRAEWNCFHPGLTPLGWLLRESGSLPWVRFHALPLSKRYAEDEAERRVIIARAQELGDRLLGAESPCWLVQANPAAAGGTLVANYVEDADEGPDDAFVFHLHAQAVHWRAATFDHLLMEIADERAGPTLWMNRATGSIFAPYDGGFDLFPKTWLAVAELKADYAGWLSQRSGGL